MSLPSLAFTVGHQYNLGKKIGKGAFGDVFIGNDIVNNKNVAIKLEPLSSRNPQLSSEIEIYKALKGGVGIPIVFHNGVEDSYNVMVMDLLGPSLEDLLRYCNGVFSLKTICMLAQEMLLRVEYLHNHSYIHRDIKPENFVVGLDGYANVIHLIDFGLSKKYRNDMIQHIPYDSFLQMSIRYRENKSLTGTPRYASLANHLGIEQSRRDDLESLGYVLVYLIKGKLPWQGLRGENKKEKYHRILEYKVETSLPDLCSNLPNVFEEYLNYCRGLRYEEGPDYAYLRGLFATVMKDNGYENDGIYDWMVGDKHNPKYICDYCIDSEGHLLHNLLSVPLKEYRESMLIRDAEILIKENGRLSTMYRLMESTSFIKQTYTKEEDTEKEEVVEEEEGSSVANNTSICSIELRASTMIANPLTLDKIS